MASCLLTCNHTVYYEPEPMPGDTVYCRRCMRYQRTKVAAAEWLMKCAVCHLTRRFGADETSAYGSARRHQRKYHHVVLVKHGYTTVSTIGPEGQGELSLGMERIQWVRQHQGALKAVVDNRIHKGQST